MTLVFIDTNVLIYARDRRNEDKRLQARAWLATLADSRFAMVNLQVLNELTRWILANEPKRLLQDVRTEIDALRSWGDKAPDDDEVEYAWKVRGSLGYGWFDCLLVAAAARARCSFFLTEDMGDRARFGPVTLVDPFTTAPGDILSTPRH